MRVEQEGVEEFVIMNEEMDMQPEGVSEYDLGEFRYAVAAPRGSYDPTGLLDDLIACNQFTEEIQVRLMGSILALLLKYKVLLQHEAH